MFRERSNLESHFIVDLDGTIIQLIDTERSADANFHANRRPDGTGAISVETADNGDPDNFKWTVQQVFSLIRLHKWAEQEHGIPRRQCRSPEDPGHGYHTLFGAPSEWTPVAKSCPGRARKVQWHQVLLPAYIKNEEEFDVTKEELRQIVREEVQAAEDSTVKRLGQYVWDVAYRIALVIKTGNANTFFNTTNAPALFESDASLEKLDSEVVPAPPSPAP